MQFLGQRCADSKHGTFSSLRTYNDLESEGGLCHVRVPALVHPLRPLLAARLVGAGCISIYLAASAAVSHRGRRRPRRAGDHLLGHHPALPSAGRPVPHLTTRSDDSPALASMTMIGKLPWLGRLGVSLIRDATN